MGTRMTYCHTSFTRRKNESKKIDKKGEKEKEKCLVCNVSKKILLFLGKQRKKQTPITHSPLSPKKEPPTEQNRTEKERKSVVL